MLNRASQPMNTAAWTCTIGGKGFSWAETWWTISGAKPDRMPSHARLT